MADATHSTEDRSQLATDMTVSEASEELLQLLPGDEDLEVGTEEPVEPQDDDKGKKKSDEKPDDQEDAEQDDAEDGDVDEEVDDEDQKGDDEDLEEEDVFVVKVAGKDEEVTLDELAKGYSRQADYTRKTQQLSDERKAFDTELAETRGVREEYTERLQMLNKSLDDLFPEQDWEKVKREDPENYPTRYADHERQRAKREALKVEEKRVTDEQVESDRKKMETLVVEERELLVKAIPAFADPEKAKVLINELADFAQSQFGVGRESFDNVENHLIMLLLNDSMELNKLRSKKTTIKKRRVKGKRVIRPGSRPAGSVRRKASRRAKDAYSKLAKSGTVKDAADLFFDMDDD